MKILDRHCCSQFNNKFNRKLTLRISTSTTTEGWVLVLSPALQDRMHVRIARGVATFSQQNALQLRSPIFKKVAPKAACAFGTQDAAALLAQGAVGGAAKRGKGGRGKKGDTEKGLSLVAPDAFSGFFLGDGDFVMEGDFVLLKDAAPAQVLEMRKERVPEVVLRCLQGAGRGGEAVEGGGSGSKRGGGAGAGSVAGGGGGGDGCSVVGSKRAISQSPCKRVVYASDAPDQTFKLERGLILARSYVFTQPSDSPHLDIRYLNHGVFVCDPPPVSPLSVGLPTVAMDAFVVHGNDEPSTDVSTLCRTLLVHSRTCLQLTSSKVPRILDVVAAEDGVGMEAFGVKSVKSISGKPNAIIEGLMLEMLDEAGGFCCNSQHNAAASAESEGDGFELTCTWNSAPWTVFKYDGMRVVLPPLRVPANMPERDETVWLKIDDETMLEAHFKVKVETGPPAQLAISLDGVDACENRDAPAQAQIGSDCAFKFSVLDERGALIEGDCDMRMSTPTGAMTLHKVRMTVEDGAGKLFAVLVRQENYEKSTQTYTQNVGPQTELDDWGNFWVRCIRLQGQVGPIVVRVEAQIETENALTDKHGDKVKKFSVKGEQSLVLGVGKPANLVLRGRKSKRGAGGVGGVGESNSQLLHSQVPEVMIKSRSFEPLNPLVVDVVDECGNLISNWKGKVLLDFKGSSIQRSAVVSSRKAGGLPSEQVLHFERGEESEMLMLGLKFKEAGSYIAAIRSLSLPDLPVWFEVCAGNVVTSIVLQFDDTVDLEKLSLGAKVKAVVRFNTEDDRVLEGRFFFVMYI